MTADNREARDQEAPDSPDIDVQAHSAGDDEEDRNVYIVTPSGG